jgi:hypothetical protein
MERKMKQADQLALALLLLGYFALAAAVSLSRFVL